MAYQIQYTIYPDGLGFVAEVYGQHIGEITFAKTGMNKIIIDHTAVIENYRHLQIGLNLLRCVADLARNQNKKIMPLCPFARAMFNRYSEFDDVRLSH